MSPDIKKDEIPKNWNKKDTINLKEDKWWKLYTEKRQYSNDFEKIATDTSFKPEYQKAAMQILLKPTATELPLVKPRTKEGYNYLGPCFESLKWWTEKLNQDQAKVAAELILEYIPLVENKKEKHLTKAYREYNKAILNLIPLLQNRYKRHSEELFKHLDLKGDDKDSNDTDDFFPYYSFYYLLTDRPYIGGNRWQLKDNPYNPYWKYKAIHKMRKFIEKEKSEKRKEATNSYIKIISHLIADKEESSQLSSQLDKNFLQNELTFLIQNVHSGPFIDKFWTMEGLELLTDNKLRHKFIKRQLPFFLKYKFSSKPDLSPFGDSDNIKILEALNKHTEEIKNLMEKFSKEFLEDTILTKMLQNYLTKRQTDLKQFQIKVDSKNKENKMWEEKRKLEEEEEKKILSHLEKRPIETKKPKTFKKPSFFEKIRQLKF